jgi:hypothetical protein
MQVCKRPRFHEICDDTYDESSNGVSNQNHGKVVLYSNEDHDHYEEDGEVIHLDLISIVQKAKMQSPDFSNVTCDFTDLVAPSVLEAFEQRLCGKPLNKPTTFVEYIIYECARDYRSLGHSLLYVTNIDTPFTVDQFKAVQNGYTVEPVHSSTMIGCCKRLFVSTGLLSGGAKKIALDMDLFSKAPYYMLACTAPGGNLHCAAVFRVHTLNDSTRLIALDLISSYSVDCVGGGTAMMRVLRDLSRISPRHHGNICAKTLRTRSPMDFYKRQLSSCNSPQDRAFITSIAFIDPNYGMCRHLDMRSTTVWPETSPPYAPR